MEFRPSRPRLEALTGLRYIAALCVLLTHLAWNFPGGQVKQLAGELWAIGMPLFFTLSGFLMAYNYSNGFRNQYRATLGKFFVARFARIYPIYLVALFLWLGIAGHIFHDLRDHPRDTAVSLAMNATMTQNWAWIPVYQGTPEPRAVSNAHYWIAWSVSVEFFFYLMFPLIIIPVARFITNPRRALIGIGGVFCLFVGIDFVLVRTATEPILTSLKSVWQLLQNPYIRLGEFTIGVLAGQAFLYTSQRELSIRSWWLGSLVLAGSVPLLLYGNHWIWGPNNPSVGSRVAASNVLYAPLCATIIYCLARIPNWPQRLLGSRPMVLLGESSYCLYLVHPLIEGLFVSRLVGEGDIQIRRVLLFNHLAMLVVLHFLCFGLYRYAEVPLRGLVKRVFEGRPKRGEPVVQPELRAAA